MKIITTDEFAKATKLDKLKMPGLAALLMELMKINQVNDLFAQAQPKQGPEFVDAILEGCGVTIDFDPNELRNIPTDGAFIAIANHPYGGIEGMILLKILCMVRPDAKLMANFLLKKYLTWPTILLQLTHLKTLTMPQALAVLNQLLNY